MSVHIILYVLEGIFIYFNFKVKRKKKIRYLWVFLCGLCYLLVGYLNLDKNYDYMKYIMVGLLLSYIGDLTLQGFNQVGIIAFALAHVAYCVGYYQQVIFDGLFFVFCGGVTLTIFSLLVFYPFFKSKTKKGLHALIFYYIIFLCVMVTVALATRSKLRFAGAALFYVSDICTAYVLWVSPKDKYWRYFRMFQLPLYYGAQILLAESY